MLTAHYKAFIETLSFRLIGSIRSTLKSKILLELKHLPADQRKKTKSPAVF